MNNNIPFHVIGTIALQSSQSIILNAITKVFNLYPDVYDMISLFYQVIYNLFSISSCIDYNCYNILNTYTLSYYFSNEYSIHHRNLSQPDFLPVTEKKHIISTIKQSKNPRKCIKDIVKTYES